jgi:serine protease
MNRGLAFAAIFLLTSSSFLCAAQEIGSYPALRFQPPAQDNGELLVDFKDDDSPSAILSLFEKLGFVKSQYSFFSQEEKWVRLRGATAGILQRIRENREVEAVEPNYYLSALFVPNDPYYKYQWHLDLIGMKEAWDYPRGAPTIVAVIDTGIAFENYHGNIAVEDLNESQFVKPHNFINGNEHANDDHGHGTHVAGTIAQLTNNNLGVAGVASNIKLMPLKVLNSHGYGTLSDVAAAIRYAADNGAKVINLSLGGPFPSIFLRKACKYASDKGVVIVAAAGNSGRSGISYPAAYPECISVSAVRYDRTLTWYSSYGKGLTIAAPGGDMNVDQNGDGLMDGVLQNTLNPQDPSQQGYYLFQGTSMATPHVAAAAALLVSHGVTDPEKVRKYLTESASRVEGGNPDMYGAGVLNVNAALKSAVSRRSGGILVLATALFFLFVSVFNYRKGKLNRLPVNLLTALGLVLGGCGLFFLGRIPYLGKLFFLTHPLAEWQLGLLGTSGSASPLFFSVVPVFLIALLLYPWKKFATLSVGLAFGMAAYLLIEVFSPNAGISWIPGRILEAAWLAGNALLCFVLALITSFRVR